MSKQKTIEQKLKECQKLKDEYLAGWKRTQADFINYKKGETERNKELKEFSNEELVLKMLPILDNLYIAENNISKEMKKDQWVKGLLQIKSQMLDFLKSEGVKEIKSIGEKFNPQFHEAVEVVEGKQPDIVIEEIRKGYILNGRIVRPAQVKITK